MNEPLFSVLIANYNNGRFLQEAIDSVLAQTYTHWEIILVDDKSTDNSFEIYDKYKGDNRFHIYFNEENKGCGFTKRRCVELANGEICGFLDPDDMLVKEALEKMVKEHLGCHDVSLVYSRYYLIDELSNILQISEHQRVLPEGVSFLEYGEGAISHFVSFKKAFYNQTVGIDAFYRRAVDHDLYFLLEEVGKVRFIDQPLYCYRENTGNNISTNENSLAAFIWDIIVMADACKRRGWTSESVLLDKSASFVDDMKQEAYLTGMDAVRRTRTYKTGRIVLKPLRLFKK